MNSFMRELAQSDYRGEFPEIPESVPAEIGQWGHTVGKLVSKLKASRDEVVRLGCSFDSRLARATRELRLANSKLEVLAREDHLTALANRRHFENILVNTLSRRRCDDEPLCVLLIDVDNFKQINDKFGHAAGDAVLTQIALLLKRTMRPGDLVARYGGDEFVVKLHCQPDVGLNRAREIRRLIDGWDFKWQANHIHVTVSIGLLEKNTVAQLNPQTIMRQADSALYLAKRQGRNTVVEITG